MRQFTSYGPIDTDEHYHAPRTEIIHHAMNQLIGNHEKGGHYITIWAPRQTGKTWVMQQVARQIYARDDFEVAIISLQSINNAANESDMFELLTKN